MTHARLAPYTLPSLFALALMSLGLLSLIYIEVDQMKMTFQEHPNDLKDRTRAGSVTFAVPPDPGVHVGGEFTLTDLAKVGEDEAAFARRMRARVIAHQKVWGIDDE